MLTDLVYIANSDFLNVAPDHAPAASDQPIRVSEFNSSSALPESDDDTSEVESSQVDQSMQLIDSDWVSDEEEAEIKAPPKTKHEIDEYHSIDTIAIHQIIEGTKIVLVGHVLNNIVSEGSIIVSSIPTDKPLSECSILCLPDGSVLGKISETFGPLSKPFYVLRYPVPSEKNPIEKEKVGDSLSILQRLKDITPGTEICSLAELASFITPLTLKQAKGSDASNLYDEEVNIK
jgi:H/ACA ribonucleoprotein complex non-core subunit NAF1